MNLIDKFLNSITMYRLLLYYLILLLAVALVYSFLGLLPFNPINLGFSTAFLLAVCYVTNKIFSLTFEAPTNLESNFITALILALIITPATSIESFMFLFWAAVWSMASKYIFAINKKHLFNPAAFAVTLTYFTLNSSASWWVGTSVMLPFVLLGALIIRKIRRFDLVFYFFIAALFTILAFSISKGSSPAVTLQKAITDSPIIFFAFIMLSEPLTTPPTKKLQSLYGALVGFLFAPQLSILGYSTTPEIALLIGNIFSYFVSPKYKLILKLKEKIVVAPDIYDFVFTLPEKINYNPGQYMEWTLPHNSPDSRGNRRYFTLASSPTEDTLRLGVKFYPNPSSFKKALSDLQNNPVVASGLSGDFTLPKDPTKKLVFIAGGIGVTPFRSIIKYLVDKGEKRDIVMFYSNKFSTDIVYSELFTQAAANGLKTIYSLSEMDKIPANWQGEKGIVTADLIKQKVPDIIERTFYLSGPHAMVSAFEDTLSKLGIPKSQIKTDFFPGFV